MEERRHDYPEIRERLGRIEERLIAVDKRINGSINAVEKHIEHGTKWRLGIVVALIGLVGLAVTRMIGWGNMENQIKVNTNRLDRIEGKLLK